MKKTSVYLPDELKKRLEQCAEERRMSEAEVIRVAIADFVGQPRPRPNLPLFESGNPLFAERDEEFLEGFGEE